MTMRDGAVSLAELVLVFWGFLLVLAALADFAHGQGRMSARQQAVVRLQEAHRTTEIVLGRELRALGEDDVKATGAHELAVRAVRGSGPVCSGSSEVLEVRYAGIRRPDETKDSVVAIGVEGEDVVGLAGVNEIGCGGAGVTLTLSRPPAVPPLFVLVFEPGSYHATDGAIRYRLGAAGRQPLTETLFAAASFQHSAAGVLSVHLAARADSLRGYVADPVTLPIHRLNHRLHD